MDPRVRDSVQRFCRERRAYWSFWLLLGIFLLSLMAELIANAAPLYLRYQGQHYFPWLRHLSEDRLYANGVHSAPDFAQLAQDPAFLAEGALWFAPIAYGPQSTLSAQQIDLPDVVLLSRQRLQRVAVLSLAADGRVLRAQDLHWTGLAEAARLPEAIESGLRRRFDNRADAGLSVADERGWDWVLSAYRTRAQAPRRVRVLLREHLPPEALQTTALALDTALPSWWAQLPSAVARTALARVAQARRVPVQPLTYTDAQGLAWQLDFDKQTVQFPLQPLPGHPMGLDESGRDVLVLVIYATRISLTFGLVLVFSSVLIGTFVGALQGYFGGWLDLIGQRLVEIYESIPFLYVMIFLGSVFGQSFGLLLCIYALFNWIGISYYMRAEFLRLRQAQFVEAAQAMGLPSWSIILRHMLPNALVPLVTFFPFMLVGAIGSLSALDYLGFGLPAGTPSWGDLLRQAQVYRHAWWLVLYPSLALFCVTLLGVFIGEGLRAAFDPKRQTAWEA